VHARELLVHASIASSHLVDFTPDELREKWNLLLPLDVRVARLRYARPSQIQVRYASVGKVYSFYLRTGSFFEGIAKGLADYSMYVEGLSEPGAKERLAKAVSLFQGTHDFSAFSCVKKTSSKGSDGASTSGDDEETTTSQCKYNNRGDSYGGSGSTVRTIYSASVSELKLDEVDWSLNSHAPSPMAGRNVSPVIDSAVTERAEAVRGESGSTARKRPRSEEAPSPPPSLIRISFTGNGFMRHQVRLMVGACLGYVRGKVNGDDLGSALAGATYGKRLGFVAAAGRGLWLEKIVLAGEGFWTEEDWCNNRDPQFLRDWSLSNKHWYPERTGTDGVLTEKVLETGAQKSFVIKGNT